jgi:monoamine oxidase
MQKIYDIIIIGAGLSGTSAGYYLKKSDKNLSILIIEAKNRTGGRTQTIELKTSKDKKSKFDCGGQWVTDTQTYITRLIKDLNLETYKQHDDGIKVLETNGSIVKYNSKIPRINLPALVDLQLIISKINRNAGKVSTIEPYNSSYAAALDSTNIKQFLYSSSFTSSSKSIIDAAIRTVYGLEPSQLNTLFALMYVKSGNGTIESLTLTEKNCAQEKKVKGGTQQISERMLEYVLDNGDALFERPIVEVDQTGDVVKCTVMNTVTGKEEIYYGRRIVSSVPLNQYAFIRFKPELPFYKKNVFSFCKIGNYMKILVTYKKAFWKEKGFSGEVVSDGSIVYHNQDDDFKLPIIGPIAVMYDATTDDGEPALVAFIAGDAAVEWADQNEVKRRNEIIQAFVRYFGPEAEDFIEFFEKNWNKEVYNGGCPTYNVVAPNVMKDYVRAVREPFIKMHLCGTESATQWQGYMDGAVESGYRVANEILFDLSKSGGGNKDIKVDYEHTYYFQEDEIKKGKVESLRRANQDGFSKFFGNFF